MAVQADHSPSKLLELPSTWLVHLVQHVAAGAGGLASAAAFSQTCKPIYALSESSAVKYRNLHLHHPVDSLDHPFFPWLARRHGRVAGLTAELRLLTVAGPGPEQLQVMFGTPGLHLTLRYRAWITNSDHVFMTKVLRPHGHLIDLLKASVRISTDGLVLQDFCTAVAACRSLDLTAWQYSGEPLNMGTLDPVAGSLVRLDLASAGFLFRELEGLSTVSSFSKLSSLSLRKLRLGAQEPWLWIAQLTNLKQLSLQVAASGDPSPLSALTGLSSLDFRSCNVGQDALLIPCTFSSLQPLSALQELKELVLEGRACSAISLCGLAELSRLETLRLEAPKLKCLEGLSTGLTALTLDAPRLESLASIEHLQGLQELNVRNCDVTCLHPLAALGSLGALCIGGAFTSLAGLEGNLCTCLHSLRLIYCLELKQLSGIEGLTALQQLMILGCGVISLQPLGNLVGGLRDLRVYECSMVQEEVLELPYTQPTAHVLIEYSIVKEVVLAGGIRRAVGVAAISREIVSSEEEDVIV